MKEAKWVCSYSSTLIIGFVKGNTSYEFSYFTYAKNIHGINFVVSVNIQPTSVYEKAFFITIMYTVVGFMP